MSRTSLTYPARRSSLKIWIFHSNIVRCSITQQCWEKGIWDCSNQLQHQHGLRTSRRTRCPPLKRSESSCPRPIPQTISSQGTVRVCTTDTCYTWQTESSIRPSKASRLRWKWPMYIHKQLLTKMADLGPSIPNIGDSVRRLLLRQRRSCRNSPSFEFVRDRKPHVVESLIKKKVGNTH